MPKASLESYLTDNLNDRKNGQRIPAITPEQAAKFAAVTELFATWGNNYGFDKPACKDVEISSDSGDQWVDFYPDEADENPAKLVCDSCPHENECLGVALKNRENTGVWGGSTPKERKNIKRNYTRYNAARHDQSLVDFAIENRHRYIAPGDVLGPFDSRRPKITRVEADALCLNGETSDLFEKLDSSDQEHLEADDFAAAIAICLNCENHQRGCYDLPIPEELSPTVVGAKIVGWVDVELRPTKQMIAEELEAISIK